MINRIKKAIKILINYKGPGLKGNALLQYQRVQPWFAVKGDETLRLEYDLDSKSIVFDVGGYKGEFATEISARYNATIYIFEPVKDFYNIIKSKFAKNDKIKSYHFGLAGKDQQLKMSLSENSSSVFLAGENSETIQLKSIVDFIKEHNITQVDLIKINIEGGEYELLESLIENNCIQYFKNIQVQFHDFLIDNAKARMTAIQENLSKTHELTYQYEFVWENWKRK